MLSFGGQDAQELLAHVPDDEAVLIREKAEKLIEIPKEKRVPLMLRQLKQLMAFRGKKGLDGVDPSWLLAGFRGESPRTVAIVLMHMPSSVSRQITARLPADVRAAMPGRAELKDVPMDIIKLVRNRFDAKFAAMPEAKDLEDFGFRDLLLLDARELVTVIRRLGTDEMATAFLAVGKRALAAFLSKLPPENAEELMAAVRRMAQEEQMDQKAANAFLAKILGNWSNTDELFQKAGIYRLARALYGEESLFIRQLSQRFPRAHGRLLTEYLTRVAKNAEPDADARSKVRDTVVDIVVDLSKRGKLDPRYGQAPTRFEAR